MSMSEALAEAYASNPVDELTYDTLEIHHPSFLDEGGLRTAIRILKTDGGVVDPVELCLEPTAPLNPGEYVEFLPVPFNMTAPGYSEGQVPTIQIAISNVSRQITRYLEQAIAQTDPITVIYRPYLSSDRSAPEMDPVITMTLTAANVGTMQITGTATLSDVHNWPFPSQQYTPKRFPGLVR